MLLYSAKNAILMNEVFCLVDGEWVIPMVDAEGCFRKEIFFAWLIKKERIKARALEIKQSILNEGYLPAEALKNMRNAQSSSPATPAMALSVSCLVGERGTKGYNESEGGKW
jgi:hypothetical protein